MLKMHALVLRLFKSNSFFSSKSDILDKYLPGGSNETSHVIVIIRVSETWWPMILWDVDTLGWKVNFWSLLAVEEHVSIAIDEPFLRCLMCLEQPEIWSTPARFSISSYQGHWVSRVQRCQVFNYHVHEHNPVTVWLHYLVSWHLPRGCL